MKKLKQLMVMTATVLTLAPGGKALAQPQGMDFQNMDPQQMMSMIQERINSSFREQMAVTNDAEWAIIEERITAVTKARMATMADGGGMLGMGGMPGGRRGGGGGGGFQAMFGQPSPEAQALQQAIDSNAPTAQIKTLIAKVQAVRKEKLAKLAKAQEDLRAVLTTRQEAIAIMGGLLN
jgi:hypothetical protein